MNFTLTDRDDRRHVLKSTALERESLIFILFLPDQDIGVIAYTWVDGQHRAGSMGLVFGKDNERILQFHTEGVEMSPEADFDDWTVGPLTVRHGEAHKDAHVTFDHDGVALDYRFEATTPPFTYHDNADGCPSWLADNRLEQSGLVRGSIRIGDRTVDFDTTGHRDHSWGRRDWTAIHQYRWVNIQSGSDIAINFLEGSALDKHYQLGYVDRDGVQSPVASIDVDIERDVEHFSYTAARFVLVDELGRTTEVSADARSALAVWPAGGLQSHDAGGPCNVAGVPGLMHIEEGWHPEFVERRKAMMEENFDTEHARAVLSVNRDVGSISHHIEGDQG
ncbi:DUF7064 domain-containing protein [Rhodococcoides kyotonense]|uniref:AttH domain-containing protein n=1 Tax=Rhodococcoides kyotonense TaxID=398843 RepID=A0A239K4A5_9NOCA|nr:hypothetical protein [Rhodococcus kyotonensis]SNT12790.1 hypothetical protein SAMN05421642_109238 [Rhodococcus kyotonensis]